jgi:hypothetical protein
MADYPAAGVNLLPRAAAKRARGQAAVQANFEERATWLEFCNWRRSASSYAAAIELWGEAAAVAATIPGFVRFQHVLSQ